MTSVEMMSCSKYVLRERFPALARACVAHVDVAKRQTHEGGARRRAGAGLKKKKEETQPIYEMTVPPQMLTALYLKKKHKKTRAATSRPQFVRSNT